MQRRGGARGVALAPALLVALAACSSQPSESEPVDDGTEGGIGDYGEDGFQCPTPVASTFCCGQGPGCAVTWPVASSCATLEPAPPGTTYLVDATPCEGLLEIQTSVTRVIQGAATTTTTFALFDATSGALTAVLEGPGTSSAGFSCDVGPVALPIANDATGSDPCVDAGAAGSAEDASCPAADAALDAAPG
jgi:hypothetical protein